MNEKELFEADRIGVFAMPTTKGRIFTVGMQLGEKYFVTALGEESANTFVTRCCSALADIKGESVTVHAEPKPETVHRKCGHDASMVVSCDEGTSFCCACEEEARNG